MNLITVITPLYKGEKYIDKLCTMIEKNCIELMKKYPKAMVEYILINDSPQTPIHVTRESQHYNLRVLENNKNLGIHQSRVNALRVSESEFVYMLDQDDEIEDGYLVSQYSKIGTNDVIVSNGYRKFQTKNKVLYQTKMAQCMAMKEHMYIFGTDMILSPGQCLIRRKAIPGEWYQYILTVNGCDDFALWLLMFENQKKFTLNHEKIYYHKESIESFSASSSNMTASYMEMCRMLSDHKLIREKKIRVLIRRYQFKINMKNNKVSKVYKVIQMIRNFDIIMNLLVYKGLGYH